MKTKTKTLIFVVAAMLVVAMTAGSVAQAAELKYRGFVEGSFFPPHNEYDPHPGVAFDRRVVARYMLSGQLEAGVRGSRLFVFLEPVLLLGDGRPQQDYNYKADPIALNARWGIGYNVSERLQLRATHSEWVDAGNYSGEKLVWNGFSLRYTFGNK